MTKYVASSLTSASVSLVLALTVGALTLTWGQTAEAEIIDRIVAKVNDEIITLNDLKRNSGPYLLAFGIEPAQAEKRADPELYKDILQDMINTRLLVQQAEELQLEVGEEDVSNWIANIARQQGLSETQFRSALKAKGIRWQDYRGYVRDNLLKYRVIQVKIGSRVKVSDDDLRKAYREEYGVDPKEAGIDVVDISDIYIPIPEGQDEAGAEKAQEIAANTLQRLREENEDFAEVAKEVSSGYKAEEGGHLGSRPVGDLPDALAEGIAELEPGEISEPIRTRRGFHLIKLHDRSKQVDPKIKQAMEKLRLKLREEKLNQKLSVWLDNLRKRAYVRVMYEK